MKISLEQVEATLAENKVPKETATKVIEDLKTAIEEEKRLKDADPHKTPRTKNEFGVILYDNTGELTGKDFVASVFQIPTGSDMGIVLDKIRTIAKAHNENTRSGKKNPVKTFTECFEFVKRRFWKEENVLNKTKEPVRVLITNNELNHERFHGSGLANAR